MGEVDPCAAVQRRAHVKAGMVFLTLHCIEARSLQHLIVVLSSKALSRTPAPSEGCCPPTHRSLFISTTQYPAVCLMICFVEADSSLFCVAPRLPLTRIS